MKLETQALEEKPNPTKQKIKNYSEDQVQSAVNAITSGQLSFRGAGKKYHVPVSTLFRKIRKGLCTRKSIKPAEDEKTDPVPLSESLEVPQHSLDIIDDTLHVCDLCGFETLFKVILAHHMTSHLDRQDITKLSCSLCKKVFLNRHIKLMHEKNHCQTTKGCFSCEKCGMNFTTKLRMINHHKSDHGNLACKHCDKVFFRKIDLYMHSKTHEKGCREVPCKVCGKKFIQGLAYRTHLATHRKTNDAEPGTNNKTKINCKYCSKPFMRDCIKRHVSSL